MCTHIKHVVLVFIGSKMGELCYAVSFVLTVVYAELRKLAFYAKCHYTECNYAECHYAECHYAECHYAECHYAESHYADCHSAMWNYTNFVSRLSAIMLNVIMVSVVAPCIIILNLCLG